MKPFGWIQPPQIAPTELITGVCLWLAAGMALSLGAALVGAGRDAGSRVHRSWLVDCRTDYPVVRVRSHP